MKSPKIQSVFIYTLLGFAPLSFSLIFTPFYTQYLSKEAYGLLNLFNAISGMLVPLLGLGIDQALSFMYWDYKEDRKKLNEFMSTTLCLLSIIGFFVITFGLLFGRYIISHTITNSEKYTLWPFILFSLVYPFFIIQSRTFLYYYRNEGEIKKYALLNLSSLAMITVGSILGVIVFKHGAEGAVEGRTAGFCIVVGLFLIYEFRKIGVKFNTAAAKLLLRISMPLFFSSLIGAIAYVGDRLIVEKLGSLELLGIYGFALTIASVIEILLSSLGNSFIPNIYQAMLNDKERDYHEFHFSLFMFVFFILFSIVLIIAASPIFIGLFISENYRDSIELIPVLCFAFLPRCFTQLYSLVFYKKKKTTFILYLNIAYLLSSMIFGIVFYNLMQIKGICIAVFLSSFLNMLTAAYFAKKLDTFSFEFRKLFVLSVVTIISMCFIYVFPKEIDVQMYVYFIPFVVFVLGSLLICRTEMKKLLTLAKEWIKNLQLKMIYKK